MLSKGRVLKAEAATTAETLTLARSRDPARGRIMAGRVYEAKLEAERMLTRAKAEAQALIEGAERDAARLRSSIEAEARARAMAELAATALALADREAKLDERGLDRTIALARLLAERLLGAALALDPKLVAALARQALSEARGAERVTIVAHPSDASALQAELAALGFDPGSVGIRVDSARAPGNLLLETDLGVLDAALAPQLERLAVKLREAIQRGV